MVNTTSSAWQAVFSNPLVIVCAVSYLVIGFGVAFYVARLPKFRPPPNNGILWDRKYNARMMLGGLLGVLTDNPLAFLIGVALWPAWLVILWIYERDDHETI